MARNFSSPLLQRPGTVDPQERRRRPLNPLEDYPYEPEMPEVPMPQMGALPVPDISPGMAAPRLAPVNPTGWDTPPRDLSQFRAWYSGQPVEGAPAAPEWGRDTQTYSRLNPVQPKTTPERTIVPPRAPKMPTAGQTLGGGQPQVMQRPRGPVRPNATMPSFNAPTGQQAMEQMQAREQRFFTPQQGPTMAAGMQQMARAGGGVQPVTNQARRQLLGQAANNLEVVPEAGSVKQAFNQFAQSMGTGLAGIPRGLAASVEETFGAGSPVPENWRQRTAVAPPRALSQALKGPTQAAQQSVREAFPVNPQDQSWLTSKIPAGFGSAGAFITAAGLGRLTGAPINAITGAAGVGMSVDQFLNEVEQTGIDPKRYSAGVKVATASGLSELVGFGNLLDKFGLKRAAIERGLDVLKDGGQEAFQGYLEDLNRKYVAANAPNTNVDVRSADFWFKRGEEFGLGVAVSAPFALIPGREGGATKVPDALQSEAGSPPTGTTTQMPPSEQQQRYADWVAAGGTPAPFASRVGLQRSRQLPGRGALPAGPTEGQRALPPVPTQPEPPSARVEAPFQPSPPTAPAGMRPQAPTQAGPVTGSSPEVSFRPLETVGAEGARPVRLYERPILQTALQGQGARIGAEIEDKYPALLSEYEAKNKAKIQAGKQVKPAPLPSDVKGQYGMAASRMHHTADVILEKLMRPYGIEAKGRRRDIYPEVLGNIVTEMQEIVPGITQSEVESAAKAGTKAEGRMREGVYDIWERWQERFGKEKGLSENDTLRMKNLVAGRKGLFFRPDVQAALGLNPGDPEVNKQVQDVIRRDMAKLMGMPAEIQGKPLKGLSLTTISPQVWRNWMSLRGLNNEAEFPGFRDELEDILRNEGRISDSAERGEGPTSAAPSAPKAPKTPPAPVAPLRPSREGELGRYRGMAQVGVPRAPLSMVPGVPSRRQGPGYQLLLGGRTATTGRPQGPTEPLGGPPALRGVPPTTPPPAGAGTSEAAERQAERQRREALKRRSPFAAAKEQEQARATEATRRPPTPPAAPKPTTAPATGRKPVTLKTLEEAGWTQETPLRFTHPDGRVIERDSGSSGRKAGWYSTDASGNQAYHEDLRGAILAATEGRTAAPAAPTTPTPAPAAKAGNAETGAKTVRQRLAEKGWNQDDTFSMTHPDGSSITRERVGLWAYVDAAGNRTTYESQGEAISAALGDKPIESLEADKLETPVDRQVAAFVAQMNPMQKGRAIAALRKNVRVNSRIVSRQDLVYERVMAGDYTVIAHPADKRRLWKEDGFTTENDISKTAMDFAEFLLKEKGYVREGDRYVPPSKPKTTPAPPTPPPAPTPAGEAVTPDTMRKAGIDVSFLESLASKYGAPPAPVTEAAGIYGPLGRAANMLERAAGKSKSSEELAEILRHAQRSKAHRAVFAVARNPNTDEQTFEKAIKDKEANKYVSPSYWEGLRTERAERAKTSKTVAPTKRKAAPVKKEPTPKPAPKPAVPTGQPINEKTLTDRGWTKQKPDAYSGPNGEKLERDADRRGEPWVYTDRAGNTQGFSSAREAIKAIISEPEAAPTPPAPVKAKPAAKKAKPATPPAAEPTPTEPAAAKGVETAPAEVKEIFREIDAGKNKRTVRRRVQDDYKDGKKALFVADNIEQIIAEAEATGKVTKVCP